MKDNVIQACIVAIPESGGSGLYGMLDVLSATANCTVNLAAADARRFVIKPHIVSESVKPFRCYNSIPVWPDIDVMSDAKADIVILPELWLEHEDALRGRYPDLMAWICRQYQEGAVIYSACTGSLMLAETGLLDGRAATSHWSYEDAFRRIYPKIAFRPEANLVYADAAGHIVTAGGATSWHDLAIHIISRHCAPGDALRVAKFYLLKRHEEGQLPYADLMPKRAHADALVHACQERLTKVFRHANPIKMTFEAIRVPERTVKRRFKKATGLTLMEYVQNLRVETAKSLLERGTESIDEVSSAVGYEDPAFFRRLFRRLTGLTPGQYRRMFQPILEARH